MKFIFSILFIITSLSLSAQKQEMSIIDFLNIPGLSNPQISPDGQEVLYVFSESDWESNKQIGHIWRASMDGTE